MTEPVERDRSIITVGKWIKGYAITHLVDYALDRATDGQGDDLVKAALRWWVQIKFHIHV